ncbi:MAG: shikimate dehydrogenase [Saprospiraceae bacterium]|nr:shikimate dehydrogenase [Saprospiraceae bacterium]MBP8212726.1 shikimate dehydrogenase [Saprospiraceae bacterium]HQV96987.1 shikimate dehydrogenase [Saprospiraceae bacterium]
MTKKYGLIGYPLEHSFSPDYFNTKFKNERIDADYKTYPLNNIKEFAALISKLNFSGLNVTIPYKEAILPYLDEVDIVAKTIGAVNTIAFKNGKTIGYNTDCYGFEKSLLSSIEKSKNIHGALVLGTGGASRAVQYILKKLDIQYSLISRSKKGIIRYQDIDKALFSSINLIINTTPLGMSPNIKNKPEIPYEWLNEKYFLYDLIYNPEKTIFLSEGLKMGCKIKNGHDMLILQAEKAWHIWNQTEI